MTQEAADTERQPLDVALEEKCKECDQLYMEKIKV